jgi:4-amino-4-deoxy-L-arabinose transferase-like glycosyltransferase
MDGMLVFFLLLAAWAFILATETGRLRWLLLGAFLVGLGFNIKMLQAFLPLPAFYALYSFGAKTKWWRKLVNLALASVLLLVVSLSWAVAVDLTPADQRPYVGSSTDNTVTELIMGHNGLNRLLGGMRGGGNAGPGNLPAGQQPQGGQPPRLAVQACAGLSAGEACTIHLPLGGADSGACVQVQGALACVTANAPQALQNAQPGGQDAQRPAGTNTGVGGAFSNEVGTPSAVRLFIPPLAKEMSWLLPFALVGLVILLFGARLHSRKDTGTVWPFEAAHKTLVLWGGWLVTCIVFFSVAEFFHDYYMIMLAAPLGAVIGGGVGILWERREKLWTVLVLALAAIATLALQWWLAVQFGQDAWWLRLAAVLLAAGLVALTLGRRLLQKVALPAAYLLIVAALLVTPLAWSVLTVADQSPDVNLPGAYGGQTMGLPGAADGNAARPAAPANGGRSIVDPALVDFLQANTQDVEYLVAVPNAQAGAPLVLATGRPVLYMGGFSGGDPVVDAAGLQEMVANGELRYILYTGDRSPRQDISSWLQSSCSLVPGFDQAGNALLYQCGGGTIVQPAQNTPVPGNAQQPGNRPPQEAIAACDGLAVQQACTVNLPDGNTVNGICRDMQGQLVCQPDGPSPLMIQACSGLTVDAACTFTARDGNTVNGTCAMIQGQLACRPVPNP